MVVCEQESVSDRLAQQVLPKAVSRQRGKGAVKKQPQCFSILPVWTWSRSPCRQFILRHPTAKAPPCPPLPLPFHPLCLESHDRPLKCDWLLI